MHMKKYSKFLSLVLRHKPEVAGLTLDANGWTTTSSVVAALRSRFDVFSHRDLEELVRDNDKQRFVIDGNRIRANQGHSIEIDLALEPKQPPTALYHGTKVSYLDSIMDIGLIKGSRQHVHLSPDIETATLVARRRSGRSVIFVLDPILMMDHEFYESANGVWLVDGVPPEVLDLATAIYLD